MTKTIYRNGVQLEPRNIDELLDKYVHLRQEHRHEDGDPDGRLYEQILSDIERVYNNTAVILDFDRLIYEYAERYDDGGCFEYNPEHDGESPWLSSDEIENDESLKIELVELSKQDNYEYYDSESCMIESLLRWFVGSDAYAEKQKEIAEQK